MLCVAGADAKIKVYNIKEGKLYTVSIMPTATRSCGRELTRF